MNMENNNININNDGNSIVLPQHINNLNNNDDDNNSTVVVVLPEQKQNQQQVEYRTSVTSNDVLIGWGGKKHEGNKRLRRIIVNNNWKKKYNTTEKISNKLKKDIMEQIINEAINNGFTFLRKVVLSHNNIDHDEKGCNNNNLPKENNTTKKESSLLWEVVTDHKSMEQPIRTILNEVDYEDTELFRKLNAVRETPVDYYKHPLSNNPPKSHIPPPHSLLLPKDTITIMNNCLQPNDVLIGRKYVISEIYGGNVRFYNLVSKVTYYTIKSLRLRNLIIKEIIEEIVNRRNGRFLRYVNLEKEEVLNEKEKPYILINEKSVWVIANDQTIWKKVSQTLRRGLIDINNENIAASWKEQKEFLHRHNDETIILQKVKETLQRN